MAKFIKLKDEDGDPVAVNVDMITKVQPNVDDELTGVYLAHDEDPVGRAPGRGVGSGSQSELGGSV